VLQCVAVRCSVLQCVAVDPYLHIHVCVCVCAATLLGWIHTDMEPSRVAAKTSWRYRAQIWRFCTIEIFDVLLLSHRDMEPPYLDHTLQHTATHCNTLQHTATH